MSEINTRRQVRKRRGRTPLLTLDECRQIADVFDGSTQRIDQLLEEWSARHPTLKRHNIIHAAKRGGYASDKRRKRWTPQDDAFLEAHWQGTTTAQLAAALGRSLVAVQLRHKRIGTPTTGRRHATAPPTDPAIVRKPTPPRFSAALRTRISASENPFLSLLGWSKDGTADIE
jgi:hypothetical protein